MVGLAVVLGPVPTGLARSDVFVNTSWMRSRRPTRVALPRHAGRRNRPTWSTNTPIARPN